MVYNPPSPPCQGGSVRAMSGGKCETDTSPFCSAALSQQGGMCIDCVLGFTIYLLRVRLLKGRISIVCGRNSCLTVQPNLRAVQRRSGIGVPSYNFKKYQKVPNLLHILILARNIGRGED